jgi:hypothetical protein
VKIAGLFQGVFNVPVPECVLGTAVFAVLAGVDGDNDITALDTDGLIAVEIPGVAHTNGVEKLHT